MTTGNGITPCRDCKERHEHCHVDCERYKEFADKQALIRKKRRERMELDQVTHHRYNRYRERWQRNNGKGRG